MVGPTSRYRQSERLSKETYSNCILYALLQGHIPRFLRNKSGRWHAIWYDRGDAYEFYAKGRSTLPYWRNLWYKGYKRRLK